MSALLRIERLDIERWGRASGFDLDLSAGNFLVLFGLNESGKSSVATALAWLIAGPGTQGVLQRFGADKEVLRARLQGTLGSDQLTVKARATVTAQRPGTDARETLEATIGTTSLSREELTRRLGGGDFTGYRRHYWVEALRVADGDDLQENVSVQAMFGGVNPFGEADRLGKKARSYLGASRGTAAAGSARNLHDQVRGLDRKLLGLPDTKSQWARIDGELSGKTAQLKAIRPRIDELNAEMRSVELAAAAFSDGLIGARYAASQALAAAPEPSSADRRVHEQASLAGSKIGDLQALEGQRNSALERYGAAIAALNEDWRSLADGRALGEAGIGEATEAEARLRVCSGDLATAEEEVVRAETVHRSCQERHDQLSEEWSNHAPEILSPEECLSLSASLESSNGPTGAAAGAAASGAGSVTSSRRQKFAATGLGTGIAIAVAVLSAMQGNWIAVALAGVGAAALARLAINLRRSRSMPVEAPDAALVDLARRFLEVRDERDGSARRLTEANGERARQRRRAGGARKEYRRVLGALGAPADLVEKFEPGAVQHLKAVSSVQSTATALESAKGAQSERLGEIHGLLAASVEQADALRRDGSSAAGESVLIADSPAGAEPEDAPISNGVIPPAGPRDAAEAKSALEAACKRVDDHNKTMDLYREAEDTLNRALQYDEAALALIGESTPEALQVEQGTLRSERDDLITQRDELQEEIDELRAERTGIEAPDNQRVDLVLKSSELLARVEDGLVRGLGHQLAERLLREAAEQHRRTQQPELLRRTQELAGEVADDWRGISVNPHAATAAGTSGRSDNLLVDSPRGEYTARRLSFGARSLLYLTLRLATIEEQSKARGVRLPLVLDDVLVGLDDERAGRCVKVLAEFSGNHQTLLLTCHERTADRARSAGAEILEIPPR